MCAAASCLVLSHGPEMLALSTTLIWHICTELDHFSCQLLRAVSNFVWSLLRNWRDFLPFLTEHSFINACNTNFASKYVVLI